MELFCAEFLDGKLRRRSEENAEQAMIEKEDKKTASTSMAAKRPGQSVSLKEGVAPLTSERGFIDKTLFSTDRKSNPTPSYYRVVNYRYQWFLESAN